MTIAAVPNTPYDNSGMVAESVTLESVLGGDVDAVDWGVTPGTLQMSVPQQSKLGSSHNCASRSA